MARFNEKHFPMSLRQAVLKAFHENQKPTMICAAFEIPLATLKEWKRQYLAGDTSWLTMQAREEKRGAHRWQKALKHNVLNYYFQNDLSVRSVAKHFHIAPSTVRYWLEKNPNP